MPIMLAFGDDDSISPAHAAAFFGLLGGGQRDGSWDRSGMTAHRLAILPDTTHYDIFASPALASAVAPFLAAPPPQATRSAGLAAATVRAGHSGSAAFASRRRSAARRTPDRLQSPRS